MISVAFICVNYHNAIVTLRFLESLDALDRVEQQCDIRCVVIDNSCAEEQWSAMLALQDRFSWLRCVRAADNLGYFGGLNLGLNQLQISEYDYVMIGNNDLVFPPDFVTILTSLRFDPSVYAICPDVYTPNGLHQNPHRLKPMSWLVKFLFDCYFTHYWIGIFLSFVSQSLKRVLRAIRPSAIPYTAQTVNEGIGACYLLTRAFFASCGNNLYFPSFLFGEEICLSWQIRSNGGVSWYDPQLKVLHNENTSTSRLPKRSSYEMARASHWKYRHLI